VKPLLTDQDGTPLISAGLPRRDRFATVLASPLRVAMLARYEDGRKLARICLRLVLSLVAVCALSLLGLLIYWLLIGVQA
jgi:hypothetical protein